MEEIREILLTKTGLRTNRRTDIQLKNIILARIAELHLPSFESYIDFLKSDDKEIFDLYFHARNLKQHTDSILLGNSEKAQRLSIPTENLPGVAYQQLINGEPSLLFISQNVNQLTGYSDIDFTSKKVDLRGLIVDDYKALVEKEISTATSNNSSFQITYPIHHNDHVKWVWEQGFVVKADNGNVRIEGLLLDITDKISTENELKESKAFIEKITSSLPNAIYVYDHLTSNFIFENARTKSLLDYPRTAKYNVSSYFRDLVHPHDHNLVTSFRLSSSNLKKDEKIETDFRVRNSKGEWIWVRVTEKIFNVDDEGNATQNIGVIQDISTRKKNEERIINSEMNLRSLIDNSTHYYHLIDVNYKIIVVNRLVQINTRQVTGKHVGPGMDIRDFVPPGDLGTFIDHFQQALSGEKVELDKELTFSSTYTRTFNLRYLPAYDDSGKIFGVVMSSMDITDSVELYRSLQQTNNLIESINQNINEGLYRSTPEKGIVYANKAFLDLFGYKSDEISSPLFNSDVLYADPERRAELARLILANKSFENEEVEFRRKDGSKFWALVSSILTKNEKGALFFDGAIRDISEQKRISGELKSAKNRAEEMNRLKSNFLANMSHEIRTPINGIIGLTQIIEMEDNLDEVKNHIKLLRTSGERLLTTITSILDLSRLEAQEAEFELSSVPVNSVIKETFNFYEILSKKKEIELDYDLKAHNDLILANESIVVQIMNNLVGNAIKFTEQGSVEIGTFNISKHEGDFIAIYVKDTGIGISEEFLPKVFLPFIQESTGLNRRFEGSGLGLSICKRYAEQLGGDLYAESKLKSGSKFTLELPLYKE